MIKRIAVALSLNAVVLSAGSAAFAQCADNPSALGTTRVLNVNPRQFPLVGRAQYRESLQLRKREVVLTFGSGPSYPYTENILKALAAECVKATFFALGSNAEEDAELLRQVAAEGHTVGYQTYNAIPLETMPLPEAKKEIDKGVSALNAALQGAHPATPFFRAPMLDLPTQTARYVGSLGLMVWSNDVDSRDWDEISEDQIVEEAIKGLEKTGGGILALQDIQPATSRALPKLLSELKQRNFKIVHVVAAQPQARASTKKSAKP